MNLKRQRRRRNRRSIGHRQSESQQRSLKRARACCPATSTPKHSMPSRARWVNTQRLRSTVVRSRAGIRHSRLV